jgi:hypothetical protein
MLFVCCCCFVNNVLKANGNDITVENVALKSFKILTLHDKYTTICITNAKDTT